MNNTKSSALYRRNGKPKYCITGDCWEWTGNKDELGYGRCVLYGENYAHRAAYVEQRGPIPQGLTVDHVCRNRSCVKIEHLQLVTLAENIRRSPRSKLTMEAVVDIRTSSTSLSVLARKYGVSKQAIYRVRRMLSWK